MVRIQDHHNVPLMGLHMASLRVYCYQFNLDQQLDLILGNYLAQHLEFLMESYRVHMFEQIQYHHNAPLMGLNITRLMVCCKYINLDLQIHFILVTPKVTKQASPNRKYLTQNLESWINWSLVHLMLQRQGHQNVQLVGIYMTILTVCCLVIDLYQQMYFSLIPMKVMNQAFSMGKCAVQHLWMMKYQHLVHIMVHRQDHQKASLMKLQMSSLEICFQEPDLDQQMD